MDTPDTIGPADGPYMLAGSLDYSSFVIPANVERYAVAITQPQMTLEQFTDKCADIVSFCQGILAVAEKIYGLKGCEDQPLDFFRDREDALTE